MALTPGTRIGPYEITAQIGAGGMGEVYRATDTNLGRAVAIKVLPDVVAGDAERLARFDREAKTLASLNHPNIATVHGLERSEGVTALVMELVEGPTLADRIAQGPIPVDEALPIARQIAEGLEAAHEQGIIHRDLKPANIKVRPDGTVKVLDFGLAKAMEPASALRASAQQAQSMSPTITTPAMTQAGMILGTAAYMSPEQARGRPADRRADIWAFGCVLFEMLTGRPPFGGEEVSDVLAAVLKSEPDYAALPSPIRASAGSLIARCLAKDPRRRFRDIGDVAFELDGVRPEARGTSPAAVSRVRERLAWAVSGVAVLIALGIALYRPAPALPVRHLDVMTGPGPSPVDFALSPDASRIVYVAYDDSVARLFVRSLETGAVEPLPGTENPRVPSWSPDGRSIAFTSQGLLKTIDLASGSIRELTFGTSRAAWVDDDVVLFATFESGTVYRIPTSGGQPVPVREFPGGMPELTPLPSRRHVLVADPQSDKLWVMSVDGSDARLLVEGVNGRAAFAPPDRLLYARQRTLYVREFDPQMLTLGDAPEVALVPDILQYYGDTAVSTADDGTIAYRTRAATPTPRFVWVDRSGTVTGAAAEPTGVLAGSPELSPDDRYLLFEQESPSSGDVSVYRMDLASGEALTRLSEGNMADIQPTWVFPRGDFVAFTRSGLGLVNIVRADGREQAPAGLSFKGTLLLSDSSRDGRWLLGNESTSLKVVEMKDGAPAGQPMTIVDRGVPSFGQFSPDGRWVAYESHATDDQQIYVVPFPGPGAPRPITTADGTQVRWGPRGDEIFYIGLDGEFMVVPVSVSSDGELVAGTPRRLFTAPIGSLQFRGQQYDVSADGKRFLMYMPREANSAISVLLNWSPASD